jgi:O-antigen ligase|tara:strand:+ start:6272 stop:7465 length:1194 start_codon:yes stop_codon:yes gene_type:complete
MFGYEILIGFGLLYGIKADSSIYSYAIRIYVLIWTLYYLPKLFRRKLTRKGSAFLICFVFMWFWYFCRLTIDSWLNPGVLRISYIEYVAYSIFMCFLPAFACFFINYHGLAKNIQKWLFISLLVGGLLVLWSFSVSDLEIDLEAKQLQLVKLNSTSVSWLGLSLAISALYIVFKKMKDSVGLPLIVVAFGLLIGLALLGLGASRATAIEFVIGVVLLFISFKRQLGFFGYLALVALVALLGFTLFKVANIGLLNVLSARTEAGLLNDNARVEMLQRAFEMYLTAPVLGLGIEPTGWFPHNVIIEAFLANGVFFGLLTSLLIITTMIYAFRLIMVRSDLSLLPILYILSSMSMMVSGNFYASNLFWVLQASVAGIYINWRREVSTEKMQFPFKANKQQ